MLFRMFNVFVEIIVFSPNKTFSTKSLDGILSTSIRYSISSKFVQCHLCDLISLFCIENILRKRRILFFIFIYLPVKKICSFLSSYKYYQKWLKRSCDCANQKLKITLNMHKSCNKLITYTIWNINYSIGHNSKKCQFKRYQFKSIYFM